MARYDLLKFIIIGIIYGLVFFFLSRCVDARQYYPGQFSQVDPKIAKWVGDQKDSQGRGCCDKSDGHKCDGVELTGDLSPCYAWDQDGNGKTNPVHRVRINVLGKWFEVPDKFVRTDQNPTGEGFAWFYVYTNEPTHGAISSFSMPIDEQVIGSVDGIGVRLFCFNLGGGS